MQEIDISILTLGNFQTNCYVLTDLGSKESIIIDPSDSGDYIAEEIRKDGFTPKMIVATHGHFDHLLAATHLQMVFDIPFFINKNDEFLLKRLQNSAKRSLGIDPGPPPSVNGYLKDGQKIKLGQISVEVITTPGHTPGSICLYTPGSLFAGDLIFFGGSYGRVDFEYSDETKLIRSIKRVFKLSEKTRIYPGHGQPALLGKEKELFNLRG